MSEKKSELHTLTTPWTFWYDPGTNQIYSNAKGTIKSIHTVSTVEDFWGMYDSMEKLTTLSKGIDAFFFRKDIVPKTTENGGKLMFAVELTNTEDVEEKWLKLMLSCIGETFELREKLNGISFSLRSVARLFVWIQTDNIEELKKITAFLKKLLNLPKGTDFRFFAHKGDQTIIEDFE